MQNNKAVLLLVMVLALPFFRCTTAKIDENNPVELYKEAEEEIKSDHYQIAVEKLRGIKNKFPYSNYSIDAQLRIADVYFMQESFVEAAASYEGFRDLHPKHEKVPYAMFRVGKSYFKDIPSTTARDMTPAHKALDAYGDFLRRFPTDERAAEAKKDVTTIRDLLAEKELSIGNFYYRRDFYDSAKPRYKKVIELYPETDAAKTAQEKVEKIEKIESRNTPETKPEPKAETEPETKSESSPAAN